jgi:hypothetical protein
MRLAMLYSIRADFTGESIRSCMGQTNVGVPKSDQQHGILAFAPDNGESLNDVAATA